MTQIVVVSAGLTDPSSTRLLADRLAEATRRAFEGRDESVTIKHVELRDHAHDLTNQLLTGFGSEELRAAMKDVATADGVIAVTPIYSGSYNGLFKIFFDVLEPDTLRGTPVLIGATAGTARHSLAVDHVVRPLFNYLHAVVVPTGFFGASEDWGNKGDEYTDSLAERIDLAGREFADLITGGVTKTRTDPYEDITPFENLLRGG